MILDLSLDNKSIYTGVPSTEAGGRQAIDLSEDTLNTVGRNIANILAHETDHSEIILTGAAPIPIYLVAFHQVVHRFKRVIYDNELYRLLIAQH